MNFKNILKKIYLYLNGSGLILKATFVYIYINVMVSIDVFIHMIKYYQNLIAWSIAEKLEDSSFLREVKSFMIAFVIAFLFYYFIVIELSILLFGYSLLCYWFFFLFIFVCYVVAWRVEVEFLKYELTDAEASYTSLNQWAAIYNPKTPYSFFDYLNFYKRKWLFKYIIIDPNIDAIEEGWINSYTFLMFLALLSFYMCSYRFDPWYVNFVAKYFHPFTNFFETRRDARWGDFIYSIIWFWNWWVFYFDYVYEDSEFVQSILWRIPYASPQMEDLAQRNREFKTSLWKHAKFGDIFYLWVLRQYFPLYRLVFEPEQPVINDLKFDRNWYLLFARYIRGEFDSTKNSFWVKYFKDDPWLWSFLSSIKERIKDRVQLSEKYNDISYIEDNIVVPTYFDALLSENYFDKKFSVTEKKYLDFGSQREMYENITNPWVVSYIPDYNSLYYVFTNWIVTPTPLNITGLRDHLKQTKVKHSFLWKISWKLENIIISKWILETKNFNWKTAKNIWLSKITIPLWYNNQQTGFEETFEAVEENALRIFKNPEGFKNPEELGKFLRELDWRMTIIEEQAGLSAMSFSYKDYYWMDWDHLITVMKWRLLRMDVYLNDWNLFYLIYNQLPSSYEFRYFLSRFIKYDYKPSPLFRPLYEKWLVEYNSFLGFKYNPKTNLFWPSKKLDDDHTEVLKFLEVYLNAFEWKYGERSESFFYKNVNKFTLREFEERPWYVWSLKYFANQDDWVVFPGFVRYYYPTPYPSAFSTFGAKWFKYQLYWNSVTSFHVSESNSLVTDWSSTPMLMYTGVEAIMYAKPFLKFFDFLAWTFIKYITYPIEFIITKFTFIFDNFYSLIFFVHLTWFLHFYIYFFIFLYVAFYFAKYYYYKVSFMWIHEWMLENSFLHQTNNFTYWHTLNDLWMSYKTPEQFAIMQFQTALLSHYTFFNFKNFVVTTKYGFKNFLQYFSVLYLDTNEVIKYFEIHQNSTTFFKNLMLIDNFKFFKYYFNINTKKYNALLYKGGSDCNYEIMGWAYYDYLTQVSVFLSRSLTKSYFFNYKSYFISLIKQLTIVFSSSSISTNFFFLVSPLLDTAISWKLLIEIFFYLKLEMLKNRNEFINKFLYSDLEDRNIFEQGLLMELRLNFFTHFYKSGLDIYWLFNYKELNNVSKSKNGNFWDSPKYWLYAFFWSFWFVPRVNYPYLNLHKSHEINRLQLRWVAYSNSWIGHSVFIWPYFNLIQHLWWTSRTYNRAFLLTDSINNLNSAGITVYDNVWNFFEKWYSNNFSFKRETVFGIVRSLSFRTKFVEKMYPDEFDNPFLNYDLTYDMLYNKNITTERKYEKTNPPLDVIELGITPSVLLSFFKNFPSSYGFLYLSFFEQLDLIDLSTQKTFLRDLKSEYSKEKILGLDIKTKEPWFLSQFDFYLKSFERRLKIKKGIKNWIFSFDLNFFFNHFLTWDYFTSDNFSFNWSNQNFFFNSVNSKLAPKFFSEMHPWITQEDHWFTKPFGVLDRIELFGFERLKNIKIFDELSYSYYREDPFITSEKESLKSSSGFSYTSLSDLWTSWDTYDESFVGERFLRAPFNTSFTKNIPNPIILGWVGELYSSTIDSTSLFFSTLYSKNEFSPVVSIEKSDTELYSFMMNYKEIIVESFFPTSELKWKLVGKMFSWLNLSLFPTSYWSFFGMKSISRLDYWSWKCGLYIDYWNGFYNYKPYFGYRHSFGSKLTVYDSLYGFYWSYRQVDDDPTIVDLETDAIEKLFEEKDDLLFVEEEDEENKFVFNLEDEDHWWILRNLSLPFWEVYYSFHHPYFIGYFIFWFLFYLLDDSYLGISNFSYRWTVIRSFFDLNEINLNLDFNTISHSWTFFENKYWKLMSRYRLYWINPIKLSENFDSLYDDDTKLWNDWEDYLTSSFWNIYIIFTFFFKNLNFSASMLNNFFEFKKIPFQLLNISWYNFDLPFSVNPYILVNFTNPLNLSLQEYEYSYHNYYLSYSHYDTLRETLNLSLLFDWSNGSYIDIINFSSYYGTYRAQTSLPSYVFDSPNYVATNHLWFSFDKSKQVANEEYKQFHFFNNSDIILGSGLLLNNLSFLWFFSTSLIFLLKLSSTHTKYTTLIRFLDIYIKESNFSNDLQEMWSFSVWTTEWPTMTVSDYLDSVRSSFKHFLFIIRIQRHLPHDILSIWLKTGIYFFDWWNILIFLKLKKFYLNKWFKDLEKFYTWIGFQLFLFFFKKK